MIETILESRSYESGNPGLIPYFLSKNGYRGVGIDEVDVHRETSGVQVVDTPSWLASKWIGL